MKGFSPAADSPEVMWQGSDELLFSAKKYSSIRVISFRAWGGRGTDWNVAQVHFVRRKRDSLGGAVALKIIRFAEALAAG